MDKNILLVTKIGKNFGAVLQAYALTKVLADLGCNVSVLNFHADTLQKQFRVYRKINTIHDVAFNFLVFFKVKKLRKSIERFLQFRTDYFNLTPPCNSENDLKSGVNADVYITGSDQVWNPMILYSPVYFLAFGGSKVKRVSYSASIGLSQLPNELIPKIKEYLSNFQAISVRESSAQQILRDMGIESVTTVDPTLLLTKENWHAVAETPIDNEDYILVYSLYNIELLKNTVELLRKQTGYKVKTIATSVRLNNFGDEIIWDAGPKEFIGLIENAKIVITSSYHGMLFSLNLEVPFIVVPPKSTNSRFADFLQNIGLEHRLINNLDDINPELLVAEPENKQLNALRKASEDYLISALGN